MNNFQKFFGHLGTVHKHRATVRKLCFKCGLYWQGLTHDLSKYSPIEFWNGVRFYTGKASPHVGEREKYGYSKAWLNHKAKNKHHAEYWVDTHNIPVAMPYKYLTEMLCDRVAAAKTYLKDKYKDCSALDYYNTHLDENQFHKCTRMELEYWLEQIANLGEKIAFEELKKELRINKK